MTPPQPEKMRERKDVGVVVRKRGRFKCRLGKRERNDQI